MYIARLAGRLLEITPTSIIVDVNGVGYQVWVSAFTSGKLPAKGNDVVLHIYHHITDASQQLFGFTSSEEQKMFEQLITVKGVGPKVALGILSGMEPSDLHQTVARGNRGALSGIPGIGKKTAERIILELKDKLSEEAVTDSTTTTSQNSFEQEALDGLIALGYPSTKAQKAVREAIRQNGSVQSSSDLVKSALKLL